MGDAAPSPRFSSRRFVGRDSDSIYSGDRERRDGQGRRGDVALDLRFSSRRFVNRDSDSILRGGRDWRDDWSLSDGEGAAHFDFPGCENRDFAPTLDADPLTGDLKRIPGSDNPRDPGLLVGDSVLGHAFGARDEVRRRGDIYLPDAAFQNIYLREVAVWRE